MFRGLYVALVTPFDDNGEIDFACLEQLVDRQVEAGSAGVVAIGTTGEYPALTDAERIAVIEAVVGYAKGRIHVIAGTGTNNTSRSIELTREAARVGADGALVITPYYNKPSQEGLFRHFAAIGEAVELPLMLYNVPGRTGVNLAPDTVVRLVEAVPTVAAVKEASGCLDQMSELVRKVEGRVDVLSGDDSLTLPALSVGASGIVSVVGNLVPADVVAMLEAYWRGDVTEARRLHLALHPLSLVMFVETSPAPVKEAMGMLGLASPSLRLPLAPLTEASRATLSSVLTAYGLR